MNDGCVPTRTLARAARLRRDADQFAEFGIVGEAQGVDFRQALARARQSVDLVRNNKQANADISLSAVDHVVGRGPATFVGPQEIRVGDTIISAGKLLICVGGHARKLSVPGGDLGLTHSDIWGLAALPDSAVVVGAAATGCQIASILNAFGARVTLIEAADRILREEDEEVSRTISTAFTQAGIEVLTGAGGIEKMEHGPNGGVRVHASSQGGELVRDAAAVILAVGWAGNLDPLNLSAAGIESDRGYVRVDDELRTTNPDVYAAGDINGHMMLVQSAEIEAQIAVDNALGATARRIPLSELHEIVPHGSFTDPEYASVGLSEAGAAVAEEVVVATIPFEKLDRALIDSRTTGFAKLIVSRSNHSVLGAHVVGEQAVEAIHIAAAAMSAHLPVESIARIQFAYPTFTASIGLAAREAEKMLGSGRESR